MSQCHTEYVIGELYVLCAERATSERQLWVTKLDIGSGMDWGSRQNCQQWQLP